MQAAIPDLEQPSTLHAASTHYKAGFVTQVTLAGLANVAGQTFGHPFDLLKIRMQMQGRGLAADAPRKYTNPIQGLGVLFREEGLFNGVFSGWRVSCAREFWYSGLRMGLYEPVKNLCGATGSGNATPLWLKIWAATVTGFIAATLSNPLDLLKVRYQAAEGEAKKALPSWPKALADLYRQSGVRGLYRGYSANCGRACGITMTQLASYDHIKHHVLEHGWLSEGPLLHGVTSAIASLICIVFTNPIDVLKTRMMSSDQYSSIAHCTRDVWRLEGPRAFYKGALLAWMRLGPHTVVTFMTFELLRAACGISPI
jgi:hypothetical protein